MFLFFSVKLRALRVSVVHFILHPTSIVISSNVQNPMSIYSVVVNVLVQLDGFLAERPVFRPFGNGAVVDFGRAVHQGVVG